MRENSNPIKTVELEVNVKKVWSERIRMTEMAKIWQEYKDGSTESADQALLAENNGASLFYAAIIDLYHSRGEFSPRCRMLLEKAMEAETGNELYRATAEFANAQRFIWGGSKEATGASPPHLRVDGCRSLLITLASKELSA